MATSTEFTAGLIGDETIPLYIGGDWRPAARGDEIAVTRPSDGARLSSVAAATEQDVDDAVAAAKAAAPAWAALSSVERAVFLHRLADLIENNVEELARLETLDVGKVVADARGFDVPFAAEAFRYFADLATHVAVSDPIALKGIEAQQLRVPYGPCGFIIPWNFPFMLLAWNIAPALAAGNTVVVKPAELTPLTTMAACRLVEMCDFPSGVINVLPGYGHEAGAALAAHPGLKRLAFTGSTEVGREVARAAATNLVPVKLELGGKGAAVVFDDVDVAPTADALASAIMLNSGQVCCTATRWIVQRRIFSELVEAASAKLKEAKLGDGLDESTTLGPVVSDGQRQRIVGYLERGIEQGASFVLEGGARHPAGLENGFYVSPALLTGPADNVCAREEIFGPVAYVMPFEDADEAIDLVNSSAYGLANSVWSADLTRANDVARRLVSGNSWINAHNVFAYGLPYGGVNLSGFGGGINSPQTYFDYLRHQTIARPL